jgi:hypothetical protein
MPLKEKIAALANQFADELVAVISEELALKLEAGDIRRLPGRPPGTRGRAARRSAEDVGRSADHILSVLLKAPDGLRAENLRAELGFARAEMARPLALLLRAGRVKKSGQRRRTVYSAAKPRAQSSKKRAEAANGRGAAAQ